jgi:hypothetical protein
MKYTLCRVGVFALGAMVALSLTTASAWKNPRKSSTLTTPVFGTHDWIAYKGYVLAGRPTFIRNNLNAYFIGTEAPDNGFKPANAGGYNDAGACHCILFDEDREVTRDRGDCAPDRSSTRPSRPWHPVITHSRPSMLEHLPTT